MTLLLFCKIRQRTVDKSASAKITAPLEKRRHKKYLTARNLEQMFIFVEKQKTTEVKWRNSRTQNETTNM